MANKLTLMAINKVGNPISVISEGSVRSVLNKFNDLTNELEKQEVFMVNEIRMGKNSFIREFATKKDGWVFTLATGGDILENTNVIKNL